jgi:hypothetical protein
VNSPPRSLHRVLIPALAGLWLVLFVVAVVAMRATEPVGSGFTRGLNRVGVFFQWQTVSFAAAVVCFAVTRAARERLGRGLRRLGYAPLVIDLALLGLLVLLYLGTVLFARF